MKTKQIAKDRSSRSPKAANAARRMGVRATLWSGGSEREFTFTKPPFPLVGLRIQHEGQEWICIRAKKVQVLLDVPWESLRKAVKPTPHIVERKRGAREGD